MDIASVLYNQQCRWYSVWCTVNCVLGMVRGGVQSPRGGCLQGRKLGFPGILAPSLSLTSVHPQCECAPKTIHLGQNYYCCSTRSRSILLQVASAEYIQKKGIIPQVDIQQKYIQQKYIQWIDIVSQVDEEEEPLLALSSPHAHNYLHWAIPGRINIAPESSAPRYFDISN